MTGFSSKDRCVSRWNFPSISKSASSARLFEVRIKVVRFGIEFGSAECMLLTRFLASSNVWSLGDSGKFDSVVISLSVKSIASWSYKSFLLSHALSLSLRAFKREQVRDKKKQTFATPRFSIAGILWPMILVHDINGARSQSVVSALFSSYAPLRSNSRSLRGLR